MLVSGKEAFTRERFLETMQGSQDGKLKVFFLGATPRNGMKYSSRGCLRCEIFTAHHHEVEDDVATTTTAIGIGRSHWMEHFHVDDRKFPGVIDLTIKNYTSIDPKWHGNVSSIFRNLFQTDSTYTYYYKDTSGQETNLNADIIYCTTL